MKVIVKKFGICFLLLSFYWGQAQFTDVINSNRPGKSMMAFSVGKSVYQMEGGIFGIRENHSLLDYEASGFGIDFVARWGVLKEELEGVVELQYQADSYVSPFESYSRNALRSTVFGLKYLLYDPHKYYEEKVNLYSWKANHRFKWRQLIPAVSIFAGANLNFSNNPYNFNTGIVEPNLSPKVMLITQNNFASRTVLVTNIIYDKFTSDFKSLGFIATLTYGINEKWSVFGESQAYQGDFYSDLLFRTGAAYLFSKTFQIDGSFALNVKDTPAIMYGGFGVSWRFEKNYKPVKVKSPKEKKKSDSNKSAKDKKDVKQIELPAKE